MTAINSENGLSLRFRAIFIKLTGCHLSMKSPISVV